MGKFNALVLAGALALATGAGAAYAADLLPPPPQPEPPQADPVFDGWYIRADVGIGINDVRMRSTFQDKTFDPAFNDVRTDRSRIEDSTFLRAGFGYQVNNWFRADVTGEYRTSAAIHATESYKNIDFGNPPTGFGSCGFVPSATLTTAQGAQDRCYDKYTSSVKSYVFMANGYVDLGTWYNLTPYVGLGVGIANNRLSSVTDQAGNNTGFGESKSISKWSPAYALMTGVAYSVTPNLKLEAGYRYLDLGKINSAPIVCSLLQGCHYEVQRFKLTSNDIHIGMRWLLSANSYGNGQALYWGQNGAASGSLSGGYAGARVATGYADPGPGRPLTRRY